MYANFGLDEVGLTDGDFACRRALVKKYITEFDTNRLMHTFRINAGMVSSAEPLGGWEAVEVGLRGHLAGHFLSACAKFGFGDRDEVLKAKALEIIDIMELCAKPNGYLSAFEEDTLDILEFEENRNVWAPYYTLHKIIQGLVDCHICLGSSKAMTLALNLAHYIRRRFEKLSLWKIDGILRCTKLNPVNEFGGIGDALYTLHEITGDPQLLELAKLFDRDYFLEPLAAGEDVLDNLHANTHLPMVLAAMHRYNLMGEEKYKSASLNFYDFLKGRTFANGNNSSKATAFIKDKVSEKSEHWGEYNKLEDALTGGESESCCAHNTERILEQLLKWSASIEYLDHLESLKYNAILNSSSSQTGLSQYHQPMGSSAVKNFSTPYDSFWCCTASGIEAMSELQRNIWFKNGDALLLNAFISSSVIWKEKNAAITQQTAFPDGSTSTITIQVAEPVEFRMIFKEHAVKAVKINTVPCSPKKENNYFIIERVFYDQDTIEIDINASLHLVPLKGSENRAAVMYGSILLAQMGQAAHLQDLSAVTMNSKFTRLPSELLEFEVVDLLGHPVKFIPLYRIEEEVYTVYLDLKGELNPDSLFSAAKDGSTAYTEGCRVKYNG
ncbi:beta-L-arabinofuranosidase domain-containing protein [Paenibacillus sp. FSL R7-0204]|uniref:beta-L-arabinofuranosidase domain-containing protein n=1 Tax=Paenibacillus sp. FSL R7-0204 TaxID=2921675 RepID=UPI0030F7775C